MAKTKNRKSIPDRIIRELWTRSAGRCEFEGCNKPLWRDIHTQRSFNHAFIAHIIAAEVGGARGDSILSEQLCQDYDNLMLLCGDCHARVDNLLTRDDYSVERLQQMKQGHEDRIELLTSIQEDKASDVLLFGANIGQHNSPLSFSECSRSITPAFYPANASPIVLSLSNSSIRDDEALYWQFERTNLENQFAHKVQARRQAGEIRHLSVFGLAPQPLLIQLGTLLGDIHPALVYQRHREPITWKWRAPTSPINYQVIEPAQSNGLAVLNISLSDTIAPERVYAVLGPNCAIWTLTIDQPDKDYLRTEEQLADFRWNIRALLNRIKCKHGQGAPLHIFPTMPVATAIELGRVRMPKADAPFVLYDQNHLTKGFSQAFIIN